MYIFKINRNRPLWKSNFSTHVFVTTPHKKPEQYPVPKIKDSVEKYLRYTKPLVTLEQWNKTCGVASNFLLSPSTNLVQDKLEKRSKHEENWLFDWWLSTYLNCREPVIINSNPALRMQTMRFQSDKDWLWHATNVAHGVLHYKTKLEQHKLESEYLGKDKVVPLCMVQYYSVLENCRIPGTPHDRLVRHAGNSHSTLETNHILVLYRNRAYQMDMCDPTTRQPYPPNWTLQQLEHVVKMGNSLPLGPAVGLLTTLQRDRCYDAYSRLMQSVHHSSLMDALKKAVFILCLDESANLPELSDSVKSTVPFHEWDDRDLASVTNCLHGNIINSGNRWFDKTLQVMVSRDGCFGANFEHTPADAGVTVSVMMDVYERLASANEIEPPASRLPDYSIPIEWQWHLNAPMMEDVHKASDECKNLIQSLDYSCSTFTGFGSSTIKKMKMSPDAFVQIALQLAYGRLHPDMPPPPTYESGSLRRFHLGRTDTVRSCSQEVVAFIQAMQNPNATQNERFDRMSSAVHQHQAFTQDALAGNAFDRHLLGLKMMANTLKESGEKLTYDDKFEAFFKDPTYTEASRYRLSTSQVSAKKEMSVMFGPAVSDGYGVCYNVYRDKIQITATSNKTSNCKTVPSNFLEAVSVALTDMHSLSQSG